MGENGRAYFRYFTISRSTGTMLARTLRCVMTTPFGSAVAPEVKMISAVSSRVTAARGAWPVACQSNSDSGHTGVGPAWPWSTSSPASTRRAPTMPATRRRKSGEAR